MVRRPKVVLFSGRRSMPGKNAASVVADDDIVPAKFIGPSRSHSYASFDTASGIRGPVQP